MKTPRELIDDFVEGVERTGYKDTIENLKNQLLAQLEEYYKPKLEAVYRRGKYDGENKATSLEPIDEEKILDFLDSWGYRHRNMPQCNDDDFRKIAHAIASQFGVSKKLEPLVKALEEYIVMLGKELDEVVPMASVHGWKSSRYKEGKKMRDKIEKLMTPHKIK